MNLFILEGRELDLICIHESILKFDFSAQITDINVRHIFLKIIFILMLVIPRYSRCKQHRPQELSLPHSWTKSGDSFGVVVSFFFFF